MKAVGGACRGLYATVPVPLAWDEQEVQILEEDFSPEVSRHTYRTTDGTVRQLLVKIPYLASGQEAHAIVTFEVRRRRIEPPPSTAELKIPKRLNRDLRTYLGSSPYIEVRNRQITTLAKEVTRDKSTAWEQVEAIYGTVREKVVYKNGPLKGALAALRDGTGDCEELTSLFIAMCRARKIPARTVWIPGHCYPEFYLADATGQGHWFPCQAAGTRAFGEMDEQRPILQKGDNFQIDEKPKERQRYVAEFLRGLPTPGGGKPRVQFIGEIVP